MKRSHAAKQVIAAELTDVTYRNQSFFLDRGNAAERWSGSHYTGTGEVFRIFDSYIEAKEFCKMRTNESTEFEYLIYDWKGKKLDFLSPYDLRKKE